MPQGCRLAVGVATRGSADAGVARACGRAASSTLAPRPSVLLWGARIVVDVCRTRRGIQGSVSNGATCKVHVGNVFRMSKMIQVRNVPDRVHAVLRARAAAAGMSLSEFLAAELRAIAERPSLDDVLERISHRGRVTLKESAARAVRAERDA